MTVRYDAETTRIGMKIYTQRELGRTPTDIGTIIDGETWANVGAGQYYVRVFAQPGWAGEYSIVAESGIDCIEDAFDRPWRNDDVNNARHLGVGSHQGTLCDGDVDYFRYEGIGGAVEISVVGDVQGTLNDQPLPRQIGGGGTIRIED